ncbi:hypothetical protein ACTMSW_08155 [Micromonospora sp. BQ11]|uniref:hypothetical protein n=1 Tax=Micromonospora sp. BQ11 TaxID=3452212 RepID=UPI003F89861A
MPKQRIWRHQRPFQHAIILTAPVCGILMLTLQVRPPSVEMAMPGPVRIGWQVGLIAAGLLGLTGLLWPGRCSTRLGLELASMLMLGTVMGMYAVALWVISGRMAVVAASFITAVALGACWRGWEIVRDLRRLMRPRQPYHADALGGLP